MAESTKRKVAACGTDSGYTRHRREDISFPEDTGGEPCGCRAARAAAVRTRKAHRLFPCVGCGVEKTRPYLSVKRRNTDVFVGWCAKCRSVTYKAAERAHAKAQRLARRPPCGTEGGYYAHRNGLPSWGILPSVPCRACLDAHAEASRLRESRRQGREIQPMRQAVKPRKANNLTWVRRGTILVAVPREVA